MPLPLIYFICTGNSARSQMAEGFARQMLQNRFDVLSGGLEPSFVHPLAIRAMAEKGIDISAQTSSGIDLQKLGTARIAVTLCGEAEERCPVTPPGVLRLHWALPDPTKATGDESELLEAFRTVRDEIQERLQDLAKQF